jgi:glycosidase
MADPLLYEVNTRQWLADLARKHGRDIDLFGVPDSELDVLENRGITHLWLMGVWPTGPRSRQEALTHPDLRKAYDEALPGWVDEDVLGSPYAVGALHVSPLLGGDAGLEALRARLNERDIKVILDFVPNHLGLDHAWVLSRPDLFVGHHAEFPDAFPLRLPSGTRFLAHGKDPYFPGWTDTVQLDYRKPETRDAMRKLLRSVADKCDGVRCDMAMLVLADVFQSTWKHVPVDVSTAAGEFWYDAIAEVKREVPDFMFLAEAYWDLEGRLCELGFDFAYDKKLYDLLVHDRPWDVQPHLLRLGQENRRRAHFLENHDEPRIASRVDLELHRAAALLVLGLPGMRFVHDGEIEGYKRFARVQLARRAQEPVDDEVKAIYARLFPALKESVVGRGRGEILAPRRAWDDNPTSQCFTVVQWQGERDDRFDLVVVNLAPHRAQCRVPLTARGLGGGSWHLVDRLGSEKWVREGDDLAHNCLFLDVAARGAQLFSFTRH